MIDMRAMRKRPIVSVLAANFLCLSLPATAAFADDPTPGRVQQARGIATKAPVTNSKRSGSAKSEARKSVPRPDKTGNFVYGLINTIRAQSQELCARYGNPDDCLEEAEVCLTMRDTDDNQVRLCLNTVPGDSESDGGTTQKSRLRR